MRGRGMRALHVNYLTRDRVEVGIMTSRFGTLASQAKVGSIGRKPLLMIDGWVVSILRGGQPSTLNCNN